MFSEFSHAFPKDEYLFKVTFRNSRFMCRILRVSHWRCSKKKGVLKVIAKLAENTCVRFSFSTLFKKRLRYRCFPVNFAKILRTPFSREHFQATVSGFDFHFFRS